MNLQRKKRKESSCPSKTLYRAMTQRKVAPKKEKLAVAVFTWRVREVVEVPGKGDRAVCLCYHQHLRDLTLSAFSILGCHLVLARGPGASACIQRSFPFSPFFLLLFPRHRHYAKGGATKCLLSWAVRLCGRPQCWAPPYTSNETGRGTLR